MTESPATGMYGIWNTKTKTFMFGIQEKNRYKVHTAVSNKVGTRAYYRKPHWIVKAIRESHAPMFFKELKYKGGTEMARLKSIRISAINWNVQFEEVEGSYYDYVASLYSNNNESHLNIIRELLNKGWRSINTSNNDISILEKDRHIIRVSKLWE